MSNEHFCSRCPNMYVFSHGDAPCVFSPSSSRFVPGDFLPYLCDLLGHSWSHFSLSLPCCLSLSMSFPGRWCSMALVGWDQQARGPGDGLLGFWASRSAPALRDPAREEVAGAEAQPHWYLTHLFGAPLQQGPPIRTPFSLLRLGGQRGCG